MEDRFVESYYLLETKTFTSITYYEHIVLTTFIVFHGQTGKEILKVKRTNTILETGHRKTLKKIAS